MKLLYFLLLIAYAIYDIDGRRVGRIVGGNEYYTTHKFPYIAQVRENDAHLCGAAIISENWIISSAACFERYFRNVSNYLIATSTAWSRGPVDLHKIKNVIVHPDYKRTAADIALIQVQYPIQFNETQKAIPLSSEAPEQGDGVTISGFGWWNEHRYSGILRSVNAGVIDTNTCAKLYKTKNFEMNSENDMFCAGNNKANLCHEDIGSPAVLNGKLAGIGYEVYRCEFPGIFTRIDKYRDWILQQTGIKEEEEDPYY